ncbi:hypothetical protein K474DRAFT_1706367 [Panus rudis PR-1116 ss-1]|nr:hypothetical protein K474DRAFT_1706367 [Panus rudis PR-1116 ss-1]
MSSNSGGDALQFNWLVVIGAAALLCFAVAFTIARRQIRSRISARFYSLRDSPIVQAPDGRPDFVDVYLTPTLDGESMESPSARYHPCWKEMMPISVQRETREPTDSEKYPVPDFEITTVILMPSKHKCAQLSSISQTSSRSCKERDGLSEEWMEDTDLEAAYDQLDYTLGVARVSCPHGKSYEVG